MADNVLKSYLVSLGFNVNETEYAKMNDALNRSAQQVQKYTSGMTRAFLQASTEIVGGLATVTAATVGLVDKVSQADLKYQEFALRMHMSVPAAREMKIVMDAMGESMENIAWIPELRERYFALQKQAVQLEQGAGGEDSFKQMRDLRFEMTRLKLESTYFMRYLAIDIWNKLSDVFGLTKMSFKEFNDYITTHMPQIASMIGDKLVWCVRKFKEIYDFIKDKIIPEFQHLWEEIKNANFEQLKVGLEALGLAFVALTSASGPIMLFRVGLLACIGLVDEFNDYISGKKSGGALAPMWDELAKMLPNLKKDFSNLTLASKEWAVALFDIAQGLNHIFEVLSGGRITSIFQSITNDFLVGARIWAHLGDALGLALQGQGKAAWEQIKIANDLSNQTSWGGNWGQAGGNGGGMYGTAEAAGTTGRTIPSFGGGGGGEVSGDRTLMLASGQRVSAGGGTPGLDQFMNNLATRGEGSTGYGDPAHMDEGQWNLGGKYQILASNWSSWATEAGLPSDASYSADNQETVARFQMNKAYQQYGDWGAVAAWWNGGPGAAESYLKRGTYKGENGYVGRVMGGGGGGGFAAGAQNFASMTGGGGGTYQGSGGGGNVLHTNVGDIHVNVNQPNASPEQIYMATLNAVQTSLQRQNARSLNDVAGVVY